VAELALNLNIQFNSTSAAPANASAASKHIPGNDQVGVGAISGPC
jgi:hypothetical protein